MKLVLLIIVVTSSTLASPPMISVTQMRDIHCEYYADRIRKIMADHGQDPRHKVTIECTK